MMLARNAFSIHRSIASRATVNHEDGSSRRWLEEPADDRGMHVPEVVCRLICVGAAMNACYDVHNENYNFA